MNKIIEEKILGDKLKTIQNELDYFNSFYTENYNKAISIRDELAKNRSSLKTNEVLSVRRKVNKCISLCNKIHRKIKHLKISFKSPYFACISFNNEDYYIGKLGVIKRESGEIIINDWRAPISNLFYEFEKGPAFYIVPTVGKIEGEISNKKQYKIEHSKMIYCFETNINVVDEILQQTLAENSSEHMKTIVASIQKEQNQIIRKPKDETLIVQGVAGSGKTSIALHRIAYLLYNNQKQLKSNNVMIFSPNKVFSSYISTVLPELGERRSKETNIDDLLQENFGGIIDYYKKYENIEMLFKNDKLYKQSKLKNSYTFFDALTKFVNKALSENFNPKNIKIKNINFEENKILNMFTAINEKSPYKKIFVLANQLIELVDIHTPLTFSEENSLKKIVITKLLKCFDKKSKNIINLYSNFLKSYNLILKIKNKLLFDDAVNLLYVKNLIFGANVNPTINHVVIDELQDYSPCALAIINDMYPCTKTALGDIYQTVDGSPKIDMLPIATNLLNATEEPIKLTTIYRSTKQIGEFANKILDLKNINMINRNGKKVEILKSTNINDDLKTLIQNAKTEYKSIAIITKTYREAYEIAKNLKIKLISPLSQQYKNGIVVSPAYLAKGLEFDVVIACDCNDENYKTELDRQQLYVACTRPLHSLYILHTNNPTSFIK